MFAQLFRLVLVAVIVLSVGVYLVESQMISTAYWKVTHNEKIAVFAIFGLLFTLGAWYLIEGLFFGEETLEEKFARQEERLKFHKKCFLLFTVPAVSTEQAQGHDAHIERTLPRIQATWNEGCHTLGEQETAQKQKKRSAERKAQADRENGHG